MKLISHMMLMLGVYLFALQYVANLQQNVVNVWHVIGSDKKTLPMHMVVAVSS